MKIRGNTWVLMVVMAIMLLTIALTMKIGAVEPRIFPLLLSSTVLVLAAVQLVKEIRAREPTGAEPAANEGTEGALKDWRHYLGPGVWILGFVLALYLLGFFISIPLFILAYMRSHGVSWHIALIFAILTPALIYFVFGRGLGITFSTGLVGDWLGY